MMSRFIENPTIVNIIFLTPRLEYPLKCSVQSVVCSSCECTLGGGEGGVPASTETETGNTRCRTAQISQSLAGPGYRTASLAIVHQETLPGRGLVNYQPTW